MEMVWDWFLFGVALFSLGFFAGVLTIIVARERRERLRLR